MESTAKIRRLVLQDTTALLDRVTYHCSIIETGNNSFRFAQSKKRQENPSPE